MERPKAHARRETFQNCLKSFILCLGTIPDNDVRYAKDADATMWHPAIRFTFEHEVVDDFQVILGRDFDVSNPFQPVTEVIDDKRYVMRPECIEKL